MPMRPPFSVSIATVPLSDRSEHVSAGTSQPSRISSVVLDARMPSLSSFRPTAKPLKSRSTMNAVIPMSRGRIGIGEDDEDPRFRAVGDPHLAAGQDPVVAAKLGARREAEGVGA